MFLILVFVLFCFLCTLGCNTWGGVDFAGIVFPADDQDKVGDEAGNVALHDDVIALNDVTGLDVGVVRLDYD